MMDLWAIVPYYTAYLSRALISEGADVRVGSISYYLDPTCYSGRGLRVDPGLMDVVGRFRLPRTPRRILKLGEAMLNLAALSVRFSFSPPAVVHVQYLPMLKWRVPLDLWFLRLCRARGSKIMLTVHDLLPHDTADQHKQTFLQLYSFVDGIICHSDHIRTRLASEFAVAEEKVSVIPHGPFFYDLPGGDPAETLRQFGAIPGAVMVLWQGIIFPYKGLDLLLSAWQRVEAAHPSACLVVAGTGSPDLLAALQRQIEDLKLTRVRLHPRFISTEELVGLYRAADIVVYPYRAITTSGALATGLALGKAMITSDLAVFRELLTNNQDALLVDPADPDALAAAIVRLANEPELREQFAAGIRAMNFGDASWRSIADRTVSAYDRLLLSPKIH